MYYLQYHELYKKYKEAERRFYNTLEECSKLISSVTPGAMKFKEIVSGNSNIAADDNFANYADKRAYIDEQINSTRNDMTLLEYEVKKLKRKLEDSTDVYDRIYYFKWIEHRKPFQFHKLIGYSLSRTYDYLNEIKQKLYSNEKSEKIGKN